MRFPLRNKISLGLCVLIVGLMVVVLMVMDLSTARAMTRKVQGDLETAQTVFNEFQRLRFQQLLTFNHMLVEIPQLKAMIATPDLDHATILDSAKSAQELVGSDLLMLTNAQGRLLASVTEPTRFGDDLSQQPTFATPLQGTPFQGIWVNQGEIYQVVASPVIFGQEVAGVVLTGFAVNQPLVEALEKMTNCHVALMSQTKTVTSSASGELFNALRPSLLSARKGSPLEQVVTTTVHQERYVVLVAPFGGNDAVSVLARSFLVRSLDQALAFYRQVKQQILVVTGVILIAALLLGVLFSNKITQPIRALVTETQRIARGDLELQIVVSSTDELGELAVAFNHMVMELKRHLQAERDLAAQTAVASVQRQRAEEFEQANTALAAEIAERQRAEEALRNEKAALEQMNRVMMDREERIMQLKAEINALLKGSGKAEKYGL